MHTGFFVAISYLINLRIFVLQVEYLLCTTKVENLQKDHAQTIDQLQQTREHASRLDRQVKELEKEKKSIREVAAKQLNRIGEQLQNAQLQLDATTSVVSGWRYVILLFYFCGFVCF